MATLGAVETRSAPEPASIDSNRAHPVVRLTNVCRSYPGLPGQPPRRAVDDLSLVLGSGEWLALLGPNGSGKSTLLRILATLDHADAGRMEVLGIDLDGARSSTSRVRARLGVVFQKPGLDMLLTVRENLLMQAALGGVPKGEAISRASSLAAEFGVSDRLKDRVGTLSGGLARRVDLARALMLQPELLLLDEPTTGLDLAARSTFLDLVGAQQGMTVIMTTHLMEEAQRADRVALMHRGKLAVEGTPAELCAAAGGRVLRASVGSRSILEHAGLEYHEIDGRLTARGATSALEAVIVQLARHGHDFSIGLPTLADVYMQHTGERLSDDAKGAA